MNFRDQFLFIICLFCFQAILAQERDLRDEQQLYEFIDADESEDEISDKLSSIKRAFSKHYFNELIFSHESGYFYEGFSLQIASVVSETDAIYYTLDGSIPTSSSNRYIDEISIELPQDTSVPYNSYIIRARSFSDTIPTSKIVSKSYLVYCNQSERFSVPVISLITDPGNFFDYDTGIYVDGVNLDPNNTTWTGNCFMTGIEWERDVRIQYFTASGEMVLDQDAGVRIHGGILRNVAQKSLRLYAREEYGHSTFDYQLLPQKRKNKYKRFILRTSFGCWNNTIIKDPLAAVLAKGLHFETQDYRPVIVLLNGEYWGIHAIRDYLGIFHFSDKYHVDKDSVNIAANDYVFEGSSSKYVEIDHILDSMDMTDSVSMQELAKRMDMNSLINYYNAEIYLNNYDWPGGNRRWWNSSEYDNGRIRWIFYDLDASFKGRGGVSFDKLQQATVPSDGWPNPPAATKLLSSLLINQHFQNEFITRAAYLMNYYFHADTIIPEIERIKAEYAPEMYYHLKRWSFGSYATWEENIESALINFAHDRRMYVNQHYISKFSLSGTSELTAQVNDPEMGQVYINDMPVPYLNNKGEYFNDVPIRLTAIPKPGFQFSHWETLNVTPFDTLTVSLSSDTLLLAVFEAGQSIEKHLRINEVMSKNATSVRDNCNEHEDWIEIYNQNDVVYNLGGLYITDDLELPFKWKISDLYPDSVTLQPYGFGLFFADSEPCQGVLHCNFKLNSDGETICLLKKVSGLPVILDSVTYNALSEDTSWGRLPDGMPVWREFKKPTPGDSNSIFSLNLEVPQQTDLHLFPNPSTSFVNVILSSDEYRSHRLRIYGLSGTILKTVEFNGSKLTIDISDLPPGLYIVEIEDEPILKLKLIVQ
jgi:hypothetical protein